MATDAFVGEAAFIETVSLQEALVEVANCHLGDIFNNEWAELGKHHLGEKTTFGLNLARNGEAVPEGFAKTVTQQNPALFDPGNLLAVEQ